MMLSSSTPQGASQAKQAEANKYTVELPDDDPEPSVKTEPESPAMHASPNNNSGGSNEHQTHSPPEHSYLETGLGFEEKNM